MAKRYYLAYGSNLNLPHMRMRCPHAALLGTAELKGWALLFRGIGTEVYLTIEPRAGGVVPAAVWAVTASDEAALDQYEEYPTVYYKRDIRLRCRSLRTGALRTVTAFAYLMHEAWPVGLPSASYLRTCLEGYDAFAFDRTILLEAYDSCRRRAGR
ncbi:MAG TPA: gamma-glutamylcyclotransferase [Candidatus Butyricicoccus stercorigallinarum]|nr:gamma-glutamylcyclotransferase [Candidatus Butyricicoccus stercorigallinarum]